VMLAKYNLATGLVALVGNVVLTALYLARLHAPAVVANALAVGTLMIVNFFVADRWIFRPMPAPVLVAAALCLWSAPASAQPSAETVQAWNRYVAQTEARIERARATVMSEREASAERGLDMVFGETIDVPSGAIH